MAVRLPGELCACAPCGGWGSLRERAAGSGSRAGRAAGTAKCGECQCFLKSLLPMEATGWWQDHTQGHVIVMIPHMRGAEPWAASPACFGKPQGADEAVERTDGQLQPKKRPGHLEPSSLYQVPLWGLILRAQPGPQ